MSDFRVKFGMSLGPEGTYAANSALTLITPGDTTPDVSTGVLFYTNNTSATAVSYFDVVGPGGGTGVAEHQGKVITVFFRDGNTSLTAGNQLLLKGNTGVIPSGTVSGFLLHNSAWYETNRQQPLTTGNLTTLTIGGTDNAPSVVGLNTVILLTTATTTITGLSGGYAGQAVSIMKAVAAAGTAVTITGAANFMLAGTASFVMNDSAVYTFTCDVPPRFRQTFAF